MHLWIYLILPGRCIWSFSGDRTKAEGDQVSARRNSRSRPISGRRHHGTSDTFMLEYHLPAIRRRSIVTPEWKECIKTTSFHDIL